MRCLAFILPILVFFSCGDKKATAIQETAETNLLMGDTSLHLLNGVLYYHNKLLNGSVKELFTGGQTKSLFQYRSGKQDGWSETFYADGKPESKRWYTGGEKDSVHTGWWPNGNKKYEYHFSKGDYNGLFTEWYESGPIIQKVIYANGKEVSGQGWRENGKRYMSFVIKNGRRYGLFNANLCYSLQKENIK